jgi:hypothetical protein
MSPGKFSDEIDTGGTVVGCRASVEKGMPVDRKTPRGRTHAGAAGKHCENGQKGSQLEHFQRTGSPYPKDYSICIQMSTKLLHYPTSALPFICLIILIFIFCGCPSAAWDQVRDSENVDELQAYVHTSPDDIHVPEAVMRIAYLEYRRAVAANTRYAYRMFMERHPDSVHAFEVKRRLEYLDFLDAKLQGTPEAVLEFLHTWPQGSYSSKARELADDLSCRKFLSGGDPDTLTEFLCTHPDISCRGDLLELENKLRFGMAVRSGSATKLLEFIHTHPSSIMVKEAKDLLVQRHVKALVRAARFGKARELVKKDVYSGQQAYLLERIEAARLDWIRSSLDPALIRKSASTFDPESGRELRRWAAKIAARPRAYTRLTEAIALLRHPLVEEEIGDTTAVDPRLRWLEADRLSLSPDEETAEFLLDLMGDSFLQVRKQALDSLKKVVAGLGQVRAEIWLARKMARLVPKATTGILLSMVAALYDLSGQPDTALKRLEEETESQENSDPFVLCQAALLAGRLGQKNKAATLTRRVSEALIHLYRQRVQAWEGLRDSDKGWLTLRQIYGVRSLLREALAPFLPDQSGKVHLSPAEELLGNWLERSRADLREIETWFEEEERGWARRHSDYITCRAPDDHPDSASTREHASKERRAVLLLILSGLPESWRTVDWTACCHPRRSTRLQAVTMSQVLGFAALIWQGKNL